MSFDIEGFLAQVNHPTETVDLDFGGGNTLTVKFTAVPFDRFLEVAKDDRAEAQLAAQTLQINGEDITPEDALALWSGLRERMVATDWIAVKNVADELMATRAVGPDFSRKNSRGRKRRTTAASSESPATTE